MVQLVILVPVPSTGTVFEHCPVELHSTRMSCRSLPAVEQATAGFAGPKIEASSAV